MDNLKELIKNKKFAVVDIETSGLDKNRDYIIAVGTVKMENGKITDKFSMLVNNPQMESLSEEAEVLAGIQYEDLKAAPKIEEVLNGLFDFCKGCILVVHNLPFGFAFLRNWGFWCGISFDEFEKGAIDTVALAKEVLGDKVEDYKLSTLADYFNIKFTHHRAYYYAETTAKIILELAKL